MQFKKTTLFAALLFGVTILTLPAFAQNNYPLTPDSLQKEGVPKGTVTHGQYKSGGTIFAGTVRDYWIYVPAQAKAGMPVALMVFQDGGGWQDRNGGWRVPNVFDNLIAAGAMPPTVAVMVNPGVVPAEDEKAALPRFNRSVEYDSPSDVYVRFLDEEFLPFVQMQHNLKFDTDPNRRAIAGGSSGGICAFTAAWNRPKSFGKVLSFIGSFTDLRGGNIYNSLIRKHERKNLRVFLQDGSNDQDIYSGAWFIGNQDVAAALAYAGYDSKFVTGTGGHDGVQGTAILPDALRWLWRDWNTNDAAPQGVMGRHRIGLFLIEGENWKQTPLPLISALSGDAQGNLLFVERSNGRTFERDVDGATTNRLATSKIAALSAGEKGVFTALQDKRIIRFDSTGKKTTIAKKADGNVFVEAANGDLFYQSGSEIIRQNAQGKRIAVLDGIAKPREIALSPDQTLLFIAPKADGKFIESVQILKNGTLANRQTFHDLQAIYGMEGANPQAMTVDTNGWLYVACDTGIEILDQAGRVNAIIALPDDKKVIGLAWCGAKLETLTALCEDGTVYLRKTKATGINHASAPVKPPSPQL